LETGHPASSIPAAVGAAFDAIDADEAAIVADMERMLSCDTSFPPGGGYDAFADIMEQPLRTLGFACERVVVPEALWRAPGAAGARTNLVARRPAGRPVCSLYFHVDTVPPGDGWTHAPLACTRKGRRLFGRGAADMKGTMAAVLAALRAAAASGLSLAYDPVLLLCTDEEGGLYPGIRYLAEQGLIEGHLLSFNGNAVPRIWAGCFGSMDLRVSILGRSAHSGEAGGVGVNAIEAALPVLNALVALKSRVQARTSTLPPPPDLGGQLTARLNVTAAHGGDKGSALPGRFDILINRRYLPEEDAIAVRAELEATIAAAIADGDALGYETALLGHLAPVADPIGPHWPRWQDALSAGFGYPPDTFRRWGASSSSDMGWVQRAGIHEILLGGLGRPDRRIHAADEFTTLDDIAALARSVLAYLSADFAAHSIPETDS
jgi:succinyl-diaminopimelate desuccinylase